MNYLTSKQKEQQQPKGKIFKNPVIVLAKDEFFKFLLDARYLNSLIDESKCIWSIEPTDVILTKITVHYYTTADKSSAYIQMPLNEHSRRLTWFVLGNQQYAFNRLFYGISIGPALFSAFMSTSFRLFILSKNAITYLDDVFIQSQTKHKFFKILDKYHQIVVKKTWKQPLINHLFLNSCKIFWTPSKSQIYTFLKL